ncbi:MAG: DUF2946 family protein [Gammaproteobacteria bacterium]
MTLSLLQHFRSRARATQRMLAFVLWGLIAQAIFPTLAIAAQAGNPDGPDTATICTRSGLVTIALNSDGQPNDDDPAASVVERCLNCVFHNIASVPPSFDAGLRVADSAHDSFALTLDTSAHTTTLPSERYSARAPPSLI